jgi:hypothetical protein
MFGEDILEESSVYQEIMRRGEARGRAEGEARGEARGFREGAELLLLGVLETRLGPVPARLRAVLDRCPVEVLRDLAAVAATCPSLDDFARAAEARAPVA